MTAAHPLPLRLDPPGSASLRATFLTLWFVDAIAATLFFVVPYATELNPVTVLFYQVFGLPGVPLAAACYAAVVIAIGNILSDPLDVRFVAVMVGLYVVLVANNVLLLVFRDSVPQLLGL